MISNIYLGNITKHAINHNIKKLTLNSLFIKLVEIYKIT